MLAMRCRLFTRFALQRCYHRHLRRYARRVYGNTANIDVNSGAAASMRYLRRFAAALRYYCYDVTLIRSFEKKALIDIHTPALPRGMADADVYAMPCH